MNDVKATASPRMMFRKYLLGQLSEADGEQMEQRYFIDDEQFAELLAAEDALVDDFLDGRLRGSDRVMFEARFMSTERGRRKVTMAEALRKTPRMRTQRMPRRWLAIAATIGALLVAAGAIHERALQTRVAHLQRENASLTRQVQTLASRPPLSQIIVATTLETIDRGSHANTLLVPPGASSIELWLVVPRVEYATYTATVQTVDGRAVHVQRDLKAEAINGRSAIRFSVPARSLETQTYVIAVSSAAGEPVEDFSISVRRP